jgi:hypothetical protein
MFCAPGNVFGGMEGVRSRFHVCAPGFVFDGFEGVESCFHDLRSRIRFRRFRGRRVIFSCFVSPYPFLAVARMSGLIFMFCVPLIVFGGTDGVGSRFHVLRSRTCFRRIREHRVQFSCFALPDSFSSVPSASDVVFMIYNPRHVFDGTVGVRSYFMFCAPGHVFGGAEGVGSRFLVLRSQTHFRLFRGRRVPFPCFALPETFWAVPRA